MNKVTDYKGHEISVDGDGRFAAVIGGKYMRAPSLRTLQNRIDALSTFEAFDAVRIVYNHRADASGSRRTIEPLRVIGIIKPSGRATWRNRPEWSVVLKDGSTKTLPASTELFKAGKETFAAIREKWALEAKADKLREQADDMRRDAHKKLAPFAVKMPE